MPAEIIDAQLVDESPKKPSKLKKFGATTAQLGIIAIPVAIGVVTTYYSIKATKVQLDLAQAQLAALNNQK